MICFPNAKINLGLNIVSKRADGYHNLETIFYPIAVKDALEVVPATGEKGIFKQSGILLDGNPEHNLVIKAYSLLKKEYNLPEIDIYLRKNIPFGAGLGGGSADAAFMLKLLNNVYELHLSETRMEELASQLGADCPFFIQNKPVFATGIGNVFTPIDLSLKEYFIVLIKPDIYVSTKEAYELVKPKTPIISLKEIIKNPSETWKDTMVNDFESSVFVKYPAIKNIKEKLYDSGAVYASMSGSGSSVFGIFKEEIDLSKEFQGDVFCVKC
ncbi:MAG: 4-(cytidine 5'-diphospho)-2-C-methyl-D-erythritol kinase [Dysgonamonadaceae bacterium]|jgi:4-diphosphocytidyl-2-C-methyl-D-erythritol kinase|nr:4-(cytidine 5'-diphospho)-2-C-methyl-D-erythritol kinase [Dysgonamonadaceae bacterium]